MNDFPLDFSPMNLSSLVEMARDLRDRIRKMEETLARIQTEAVVGGGMVTVKANAKGEVLAVTIDPELLAMNDKVMAENLVLSGVNQALHEARKLREEEIKKIAGGLILPGWLA